MEIQATQAISSNIQQSTYPSLDELQKDLDSFEMNQSETNRFALLNFIHEHFDEINSDFKKAYPGSDASLEAFRDQVGKTTGWEDLTYGENDQWISVVSFSHLAIDGQI